MNNVTSSRQGGASAREIKPFIAGWCILLGLLELYAYGYLRGATELDFRAFYAAGYLVRTHPSHLYDLASQALVQHAFMSSGPMVPFYHLGYEALLFAPFSLLHYHAAYLCFLAFNMLLLLAVFLWAWPGFSRKIPGAIFAPGLPLLFFLPNFYTLLHGQDCILSLLLCSLCWRQLEAGKDTSAGCLLALTLYKFHYAIPIAIIIAVRCGPRFIKGFALTAAGLVLMSFGMVGVSGTLELARVIHGAASAIGNAATAQRAFSVYPLSTPNLSGLLFACGSRFLASPFAFNVLWAVAALAVFLWCVWMARRSDLQTAFSIAVVGGLLVSYHLGFHDLTLLLLPLAILNRGLHRVTSTTVFILPLVLFVFGVQSFLMAIPMLMMLVDIHLSLRSSPHLPQPVVSAAAV